MRVLHRIRPKFGWPLSLVSTNDCDGSFWGLYLTPFCRPAVTGADALGPVPVKEKVYIYWSERAMGLSVGSGFWVLGRSVYLSGFSSLRKLGVMLERFCESCEV